MIKLPGMQNWARFMKQLPRVDWSLALRYYVVDHHRVWSAGVPAMVTSFASKPLDCSVGARASGVELTTLVTGRSQRGDGS